MLIKDWMTTEVITIDENFSLMRASRIMREHTIRRLPVVSHGKLVGIITDRDIKDASPAKSTSLDVHELYYLLSEMKVKEVMTAAPLSLTVDDTLEKASLVMLRNRISGLPVLDDSGRIAGLLSESDVLSAFIHATGMQEGAVLYILQLSDKSGSTSRVVDIVRKQKARLISILTSYEDAQAGMKRVSLRIKGTEEQLTAINEDLAASCEIIHHATDNLQNLPVKKS